MFCIDDFIWREGGSVKKVTISDGRERRPKIVKIRGGVGEVNHCNKVILK